MFTVYIDDSGCTDPAQPVAIAATIIVPSAQIARLESEWATLKQKENFSNFHTAECVARNPKSEYANWDEEKQSRVFKRVRDISKKYGLAALSFAVNKQDYDEVIPPDFRQHTGKHHFSWAIRQVLSQLYNWQLARHTHPLEYIFDWMRNDERKDEILTVLGQCEQAARDLGRDGDFQKFDFRPRSTVVGLQCADAVSWTSYQFALLQMRAVPLKSTAETAWRDFGGPLEGNGWLHAVTILRKNLQKWVTDEMTHGKSIEKFKQWEEQHKIQAKVGK